ncbi:conserved hypothetical protein [Bradyrhizobium sp. ORS 285]|nr:conserved hypothetical protein [Bradyrhizobium sp. ORS 285]
MRVLTKSAEDLRPYALCFPSDLVGYGQLIGFGSKIPYRAG